MTDADGNEIILPFRAYQGNAPYVFISYAHKDSDMVYPILKELYKRNVLMWYDEGIDAGAEWPQVIADRILNCSKVMLFVSPDSISSHHVRQEINFANGRHKSILPVHLKATQLNAGIEMTLSVFQAVFLYAYKNNDEDFYRQLYKSLTEDLLNADAEITFLDETQNSEAVLRLDEGGDKSLPAIIPLLGGVTFSIGRFDVKLGVKQSDFEFTMETKNISRRHAVFERLEYGYIVTDLGSKAGTFVNGKKLEPNKSCPVNAGDIVSFGGGGARYVLEIGD